VTGREQSDPALDRLVRSGNMAVILTARILALIEDSGASKLEVISALGVVEKLLLTLPMSFKTEESVSSPP
jgi:hypothetical protein